MASREREDRPHVARQDVEMSTPPSGLVATFAVALALFVLNYSGVTVGTFIAGALGLLGIVMAIVLYLRWKRTSTN
jgi:hypothetical protein